MSEKNNTMKMPELLVFAKMFIIGLIAAEVFRSFYYLGTAFASVIGGFALWANALLIATFLTICLAYALNRGAHVAAAKMCRSRRLDLLIAIFLGVWSNELAAPWLSRFHAILKNVNPYWALIALLLLCTVLLSPLFQRHWPKKRQKASQLHFFSDEEIGREADDWLSNEPQAKSFAETVLASDAHSGLVFGVDGPWGVGKTSFINLAERYWEQATDRVIVCRFEPLRYASEPDLADRLIRDLSATIQNKVFAPELRPMISRYSRLIKGKADISFLGFKLSLEPSQETVDELLDNIDEVLRRIGRRVIVVIDDLDRLDAKNVNNVLFATRRTFKLSNATYILCYDTEILAGGKEDEARARVFLEKFVTVKLSLFVDSSNIQDFLRRDWANNNGSFGSISAERMIKLGGVLNALADILKSDSASNYLPLIGDLRKVKRFINAILLMQIEKIDLDRTDLNKRDLIHLLLLHLNYPGLFRRIYAEETEGRSGTFSAQREYGATEFKNTKGFTKLVKKHKGPAGFLLGQLFDVGILDVSDLQKIDESVHRSRACFNKDNTRNLEKYLRLIVRFETPDPQETFALYQSAVDRVQKGEAISTLFAESDFLLEGTEKSHEQFWRVLVNQAHNFDIRSAEDAIATLIEYLPRYSSLDNEDRGLRSISIYSLLRLLDQAGWGRTAGRRRINNSENIIEIASRIFGEQAFNGKGILELLASADRGVLGWRDLMLFRLQCSADRGGQLHNLQRALIVDQDISAQTSGLTSQLALLGMRKLSPRVFANFKRTYINAERNFIAEAYQVPVEAILGQAFIHLHKQASLDPESENVDTTIAQRVAIARLTAASFAIYQLSNAIAPNGSGVGCGYYDESGIEDGGGISKLMNEYIFGFCFSPAVNRDNVFLFLDHCLAHLTSPFFSGRDEDGFVATKSGLPGGLNPKAMGEFWREHSNHIRELDLQHINRCVYMPNYIASYRDDLNGVFAVLDELANEVD